MAIFIAIIIVISCMFIDIYFGTTFLTISLLISSIFSGLINKLCIPILKNFKLNQIIRKEGPAKHLEKQGTPTMGGIIIVPIGILFGNLITIGSQNYDKIIGISLLTISFMIIGFLDDWTSLIKHRNKGLSARRKLFLQAIFAFIFLIFAFSQQWIDSEIYLFFNSSLKIGLLIWPLALFVLLAESNATNLTDGLDGLASGCGALVFTGLAIQLILRDSNNDIALANLSIAMAGAWLGFLLDNKKPAKIFMGDTGSLPMGVALGSIALVTNSLWSLFVMGGIFLAESLSVILQVWIFKLSKKFQGEGKRIFLMAPLHHHFELKGQKEITIVNNFWVATIFLICVGILFRTNS